MTQYYIKETAYLVKMIENIATPPLAHRQLLFFPEDICTTFHIAETHAITLKQN